MNNKYKLTIAVLTMNRSEQLKNALESCILSVLPDRTQFVVVDNASTDDTKDVVEAFKKTIPYDLIYHKNDENRGVGGGRNVCFDLSEGEYIYFLDDDAEIPQECCTNFFVDSLTYMDENTNVATLTTNVKDEVFGERKMFVARNLSIAGYHCVYSFHGGTVFVRKSCFSSPMFMNIMYGNEEIAISMAAFDKGFYNVYNPDIFILHLPKVNKWKGDESSRINVQGVSNIFAIKSLLYPWIFRPVLYMAYKARLKRYDLTDKSLMKEFQRKRKDFCKQNKLKKIKVKTVLNAYKEYGLTVF